MFSFSSSLQDKPTIQAVLCQTNKRRRDLDYLARAFFSLFLARSVFLVGRFLAADVNFVQVKVRQILSGRHQGSARLRVGREGHLRGEAELVLEGPVLRGALRCPPRCLLREVLFCLLFVFVFLPRSIG